MAEYDTGYKRLFSHPEMVADLLTGFVNEPWVKDVQLDTLEKISGTFVSEDFRERESDVIWRLRFREEWLYVYLLLEFQSTVDRWMALRIAVYVGLLYQELLRRNDLTSSGQLPPVLPIVLYNGERPWTAPRDVIDLVVDVPGGLEAYRPQWRYLLLEEREYRNADLAGMRNLAAALFRLENSVTPADVRVVIDALRQWLKEPRQAELARCFVDWLREVLLPKRMPDAEPPQLNDLREARTLLAERVKEWTRKWRQEGLEQGLSEGQKKGEAGLLLRLMERKFGSLDPEMRDRIDQADANQLLQWADRLLTAERVEQIFE